MKSSPKVIGRCIQGMLDACLQLSGSKSGAFCVFPIIYLRMALRYLSVSPQLYGSGLQGTLLLAYSYLSVHPWYFSIFL